MKTIFKLGIITGATIGAVIDDRMSERKIDERIRDIKKAAQPYIDNGTITDFTISKYKYGIGRYSFSCTYRYEGIIDPLLAYKSSSDNLIR